MDSGSDNLALRVRGYLDSRPELVRWRERLLGRRYLLTQFQARPDDRPGPVVVVAHSFRDAVAARWIVATIEQEWPSVPAACREAYDEILLLAPEIVVVQLRRQNLCGCLAHRHVLVREPAFAEPHECLGNAAVGEMDIAYRRVQAWTALPLTDTAFEARFVEGSRHEEFRRLQLRLKLLAIVLHETNHLVFPRESEHTVRERSMSFYRASLIHLVEQSASTLSLTIDRSFSRLR